VLLLVATTAAFVSRSQGADSPPASASKPPELTARQKLMSQFDLDKNGKLEPAEREAYLKRGKGIGVASKHSTINQEHD
jgi:hypothetical protein